MVNLEAMKTISYKTLLLGFILAWSISSKAQWAWKNHMSNEVYDVKESPSGNYFAAYKGYGEGNTIVKLDSAGNDIWSSLYTDPYFYAVAYSVIPQDDGGVVVFGLTVDQRPWFYKLDAGGEPVWETSDWSDTIETMSYYTFATMLGDGSFVAVGTSGTHIRSIHVSSTGELLDQTIFMGSGVSGSLIPRVAGITATSDGGWATAGSVDDKWILWKFDEDNVVEWHTITYKDGTEDAIYDSFSGTSDGGFLLGCSNSDATIRLKRFSNIGDLEWEKVFTDADFGSNPDGAPVAELADGRIAVAYQPSASGNFYSVNILNEDGDLLSQEDINLPEYPDYVIVDSLPTDTGGYYYIYDTVPGDHGSLYIWSLEATPDGGYTIGGSFDYYDSYSTIIKSAPDGTLEGCYFNCIWPGDADNDGTANMDDLLALGVSYGKTGIERLDTSTDWYAHYGWEWRGSGWNDTLADGTNLMYTDCNGNGEISGDDTLAISLNYSLTHTVSTLKTSGSEYSIYLAPLIDTLPLGLAEIPVMLSDEGSPVEIYGIKFAITYTGDEVIDSASLHMSFDECWMGDAGNILTLQKGFPGAKLLHAGITRKNHENITGSGQVGTLSFVVVDNIAGKTNGGGAITFTIDDIHAITKDEEDILVSGSEYSLSTGINEPSPESTFSIYPNPVSTFVHFEQDAADPVLFVTLYAVTGELIKSFSAKTIQGQQIYTGDLPAGQYVIRLRSSHSVFQQTLVIMR